jgi:3-oxoadipate enol-lactonase
MSFATINGAVMHFCDEGARSGRAIAFINSLGTDLRIWDAVVAPLTDANRIVRYDKRGHGLSELPAGASTMADYARDLAALLDHLGVRGALIVGLSIGGLIAQELYRQRPELVGALILSDTAAKIGTEEMWASRIAAVENGGIASIADSILQRWFSAAFRVSRTDELIGWRMMLTRTDKAGYLAACGALREADLRPFCARIRVPTLCIVGEEDGSTPVEVVRELAGMIGGARFEIIAGAGHLPNLEKPDAIGACIATQLRALPEAS